MKYIDLHIHTPYCGHATGSAEETIQEAIRKGFDTIGFSEHFPYPESYKDPIPDCVVPRNQWNAYLQEIEQLQRVYDKQINIRSGIEIDYLRDYEDDLRKNIRQGNFDYVYGSIHLIDNIGIDFTDDYLIRNLESLGGANMLWEKYWDHMERLIRMNMVDIIAHLDLPKKLKSAQPDKDQTDQILHILKMIKSHDLVLEINTGGMDRAYHREFYPSRNILQHAAELGIEMTLGSDAHAPDQIGRYFDQAIPLLKSYGWEKIITFTNRKKEYVELYQ